MESDRFYSGLCYCAQLTPVIGCQLEFLARKYFKASALYITTPKLFLYYSKSLKFNQQDAKYFRSIYFYKSLYMSQAFPPPIIRSTKLYIQRQVLSNQYCCLLLSWMRWNTSTIAAGSSIGLTIPDAVCTVLCS